MSASGASPAWQIESAVPGLVSPALPGPAGAAVLALLYQFESTQWLPPELLRQRQLRQLAVLLEHAAATVPYYRQGWGADYDPAIPLTRARFSGLPLLTRRELQQHFVQLKSSAAPPDHGRVTESSTSGSTGSPVRVLNTALSGLFGHAVALRDHAWHRRDLRGKLAIIRHGIPAGEFAHWGAAAQGVVREGASVVLGVSDNAEAQLTWLEQQQPDYLMTCPFIAAELAKRVLTEGNRLSRLREVRTFGEAATAEMRDLCRRAWGVRVTSVYCADEVGCIALQCPLHEHYHTQEEDILVEVLDRRGRPCGPGERGRVVVTALHNFAMPLIRYALGDYAELGEPCSCGRGLPVLRRIAGRVRTMPARVAGAPD